VENKKPPEPDHFSRIDPRTLHSESPGDFPLLSNVVKTTFTLKAGEMLYLPASWFHEVTSFNEKEISPDFQGHLAFNIWVHPPATNNSGAPYEDEFWPSWWSDMMDVMLNVQDEEILDEKRRRGGSEEEQDESGEDVKHKHKKRKIDKK